MRNETFSDEVRDLRAAGLRVTGPRVAILGLLRGDRSHPTAEEVWERLRVIHPGLSKATVYNTLEAFTRHGLCRRMPPRDGRQRFDGVSAPHHHALCIVCGALEDIPGEAWSLPEPPPGLAPRWALRQARVTLEGTCPRCREAGGSTPPAP